MADARERRRVLWIGGVLGALLLLALVVGPGAAGDPTTDPRMSSYLTTDAGVRGLYLAMEALGQPVVRNRLPPAPDDPPGALLLFAPQHPPDSAGVLRLKEWVEDGGLLVLGLPRASGALNRMLGPTLPLRMVEAREGVAAFPTERGATHRWLEGVDSIPGIRRVLDVDVTAGPDPEGEDDPTSPTDPVEGPTPSAHDPSSEVEVLMADPEGRPVVATWPLGEGRVLVLSDPAPLGNRPLQEAGTGAATLVVRSVAGALEGAAEGQVRFDEYHQGFRGDGSPARALMDLLLGSGPGRWLLQGIIAVLLLVLLAARRFGAPIPEEEVRSRTPLEHMEALAVVYRKAGAERTVRERLVSGLERRLGRKVVVDGRLELTPALRDTEAGRRLLAEWEKGKQVELDALARAMDDLIAEMKG